MIIYDDTRIGGKPSDPLPRFEKIQLINYNTALLQRSMLRNRLEQQPDSVPVILGMENNSLNEVYEFLGLCKDVLQELGLRRPISVYGHYNREFWAAVRYREQPGNVIYAKSYLKWIESIEANAELYEQLDFLCPSIYTFYPAVDLADKNVERWKIYATENVAIAKTFDKPVYPYMMINYHPSGPLLPAWFIQFQIEQIIALKVDAMIWFSGIGFNWDTTANIRDFYTESLKYLD